MSQCQLLSRLGDGVVEGSIIEAKADMAVECVLTKLGKLSHPQSMSETITLDMRPGLLDGGKSCDLRPHLTMQQTHSWKSRH
jgi:hypothetical protein